LLSYFYQIKLEVFLLYKKTCPYCKGDSYSASSTKWICPYCGADLSAIIPKPINYTQEQLENAKKIKLLPIRPEKKRD
jgi:glutaredoxin